MLGRLQNEEIASDVSFSNSILTPASCRESCTLPAVRAWATAQPLNLIHRLISSKPTLNVNTLSLRRGHRTLEAPERRERL
jgi:hypothetical protein